MEKTTGLGTGRGFWLMDMYFEQVHVTPGLAREILDRHNNHNRDANTIHIDFLANQMINGKWITKSGLAIKFNSNMEMVDGQQRLNAIIESGKPADILAISYVDDNAFLIYDTQRTRTAADSFKIKGYAYHVQLAALTKRYMLLVRDALDYNKSSKRLKITPNDQLAEYEQNKEYYDDILLRGIKLNSTLPTLTTTDYSGFMVYLIKYKGHNPEKVYSFFNQFVTIEPCEYRIIDEIRRRLIKARDFNRKHTNPKRSGLPDSLKTSYIAIAWNAFITSRKEYDAIRIEDGVQFL